MKKTAYETRIEAIIKLADVYGFTTELARQFKVVSGKKINRTAIDRWLKPDKSARVIPNAITAEHLMKAAELTRKKFSNE